LRLGLQAAAIVCLAFFPGLIVYERLSWDLAAGHGEYERLCGNCHSARLPHRYAMAPAEWQRTVNRMAGDAAPQTRRRVANFLTERRSADGPMLFRLRCSHCHARAAVEPYLALDDGALAALLRQHIAQNNFAIQKWEGDLIVPCVLALRARRPVRLGPAAAARQAEYQNFCGLCHNISFLYRRMCTPARNAAEWRAVVERMREKAPDAADAGAGPALTARAAEICGGGPPGV